MYVSIVKCYIYFENFKNLGPLFLKLQITIFSFDETVFLPLLCNFSASLKNDLFELLTRLNSLPGIILYKSEHSF